jgi:hypothetical protein
MSADFTTHRAALAKRVLAVAVLYADGRWRAYVDAVRGHDHAKEYPAVVATGIKLREGVARAMFPNLRGPYSH